MNDRNYPIDEDMRHHDPNREKAGVNATEKKHAGTSECDCTFIALDGAAAAYELLMEDALCNH